MAEGEAPRRTLFEIEREKRWRIWLLFALLLALVFVTAWVACFIVLGIAYLVFPPVGPPTWLFSPLGVAVVLGGVAHRLAAVLGRRARGRARPAA